MLTALLAPGAPGYCGEVYLPDFKLDSMKASDVPDYRGPAVPKVPPPVNTGYDFRVRKDYARLYRTALAPGGCRPFPQKVQLYDLLNARKVRLTGAIALAFEAGKGQAEIIFPGAEFDDAQPEDRSALFVRVTGGSSSPQLSWASVICSGSRYLGYKGASLKLPEKSGAYALDETLALGAKKVLIEKTHPWLAAAEGKARQDANRLCAAGFPEKMKAFSVGSLPAEADGFNFLYDAARNALRITWKTAP
ncbi:MAG: hypothetical protein A3J79_13840 [Elusimicrobia bacterium RIFOXYB2_FULL_62_6]|nr:MAG: hypothetical protein A3J79_13840 [Elusimicrobia bacterium RIFOXYB2_FULL_62_6]